MSILQSVLGFVLAIGILVAFHEFGHYWVAKRLGVRVLRYSIGFGKPLFSWTGGKDGTEYALSAIPLGGYVKMLDEREGNVAPEELHRTFNRKPVAVRAAIVAAGPAFNFLFALVAYWLIFVVGTEDLRPVIGAVEPDSPAAMAGLQSGDELTRIAGQDISGWEQALIALLDAGVSHDRIELEVTTPAGQQEPRTLDLQGARPLGDEPNFLRTVGIAPWTPILPAVIGTTLADGPAAAAGLKEGDRIIAIDDHEIDDWADLVDYVGDRPDQEVRVRTDGATSREVTLTLGSREIDGRRVGMLGVSPEVPEDVKALYQSMLHEVRYGPWESLQRAIGSTWTTSSLTVKVMWRMVTGEASIKNLGGPVHIAQFAGQSVGLGVTAFLKFLALVSVSLAVLNLLPVPVLDGGHLLYYAIEVVRGRPLSDWAQGVGQQVGMGLLFMLMALALYNDFARLLGS